MALLIWQIDHEIQQIENKKKEKAKKEYEEYLREKIWSEKIKIFNEKVKSVPNINKKSNPNLQKFTLVIPKSKPTLLKKKNNHYLVGNYPRQAG